MRGPIVKSLFVIVLIAASCGGDVLNNNASTSTGVSGRPEDVALAWFSALEASDLDAAAALMAPASLAYVDERGGLSVFATELTEGWGAWARVDDRRVWSVTGRFTDDSTATAVVVAGTVEQEGMEEHRTVSILIVEDGSYLVHPFTQVNRIGFVVPRADFVDRVAPDVPFELAMPAESEILMFLDDSAPLPIEFISSTGEHVRVNALADPLPQPGEHTLTVIHRTAEGELSTQAVRFATYP